MAGNPNGGLLHISLGPMASIVSTHFWNATTKWDAGRTDIYHHTSSGRVATPRQVMVDWSGPSRLMDEWPLRVCDPPAPAPAAAAEGEEAEEEGDVWGLVCAPGEEEVAAEIPDAPNWWKYIVPKLHERSLQLLPPGFARSDPSGRSAFSAFGQGQAEWQGEAADTFEDTVRFFAEEMDVCQGVVLLCDGSDAFGGVAHHVASSVVGDVLNRRTPVAAFPLWPLDAEEAGMPPNPSPVAIGAGEGGWDMDVIRRWEQRGINRGLCHSLLSEVAAAYVPTEAAAMGIANPVDYGAVVATAMDTALLPCRFDAASPGGFSLHDWASMLRSDSSMRCASLSCALPVPLTMQAEGMSLAGEFERHPPPYDAAYRPLWHAPPVGEAAHRCDVVAQAVSARGMAALPRPDGADPISSIRSALLRSLPTRTPRTLVALPEQPFLLTSTFPRHILPPHLNVLGWHDPDVPPDSVPRELPVVSYCSTTHASGAELRRVARRMKLASVQRHTDQRMERDEWREVLENVDTLADSYDTGDGSDSE
eukprot:TRINITY_DN35634_c0_g1_i1.p1 TRINITY_DN35634_c0_g1~~TRINITY_DN35634_c0_g1_i1.p1  ORF type:complete len:534 (+),score=182.81 TRINITY_DN35634_c0_g1_i1:97-1698(+)